MYEKGLEDKIRNIQQELDHLQLKNSGGLQVNKRLSIKHSKDFFDTRNSRDESSNKTMIKQI